jgi:hypothetical protein
MSTSASLFSKEETQQILLHPPRRELAGKETHPIDHKIMPVDQTHPWCTEQHDHVADLVEASLAALSGLIHGDNVVGDFILLLVEEIGSQETGRDTVDADVATTAFKGGLCIDHVFSVVQGGSIRF